MPSLRIYYKPVLGLRCLQSRPFSSSSSVKEDNRQLLKAGARYLSEENIERTRKNVELRKLDIDFDHLVGEYHKYLQLQERISDLEHEKKRASEIISSTTIDNEKEDKMNQVRQLKSKLSDLKAEMHPVEKSFIHNVSFLPNNIHPDAPIGHEPRLVEYLNKKHCRDFTPLDYKELGKRHDLFDIPSAAQCSGEGFYYLKGEAAVLELALIQYAMSKAIKNGYYPISTPDVIRTHVADRCGYQARSGENQYYLLANEDKCLSGTAEIPLAGMYLNKNVLYSDLPIK
ncbi:PREDICTED: serine--tRNA ligase, chloroplastic/mitochondrial-like [Amphimedon queenslandica]|nr:PREDICTED: serine--tRNA ligase, chloroplastic/mitochondrial-like [Amphimedon queenslandica]|eukprot:XP_019859621.1 PREDICTED: serine--tRNA ligase, chloroplastic/mitochondrial-like [Amphimedon queenslandica]